MDHPYTAFTHKGNYLTTPNIELDHKQTLSPATGTGQEAQGSPSMYTLKFQQLPPSEVPDMG